MQNKDIHSVCRNTYIDIYTVGTPEGEGMTYSEAAVFPVQDTTGATMAIGGLMLLFPGEGEG